MLTSSVSSMKWPTNLSSMAWQALALKKVSFAWCASITWGGGETVCVCVCVSVCVAELRSITGIGGRHQLLVKIKFTKLEGKVQ